MTIIAVLTEPPRPGLVFSELTETSPFSEIEIADFYAAVLKDVCITVEWSGGDFLANYRTENELPGEFVEGHSSEAKIRSIVADALDSTDNVRSEPRVGSMFPAHVGNTISHLFNEEEEVHSAAAVQPIAPLFGCTYLSSAAMKLRSMPVVLGPLTEGRVYLLSFLDPIGFIDAYVGPEVEMLVCRADDASHGLDYASMPPTLEAGTDPATVMPMLRSRVESERSVSEYTAAFVFEEGLRIELIDGVLELVRD